MHSVTACARPAANRLGGFPARNLTGRLAVVPRAIAAPAHSLRRKQSHLRAVVFRRVAVAIFVRAKSTSVRHEPERGLQSRNLLMHVAEPALRRSELGSRLVGQ